MNPTDKNGIEIKLGSKVQYTNSKGKLASGIVTQMHLNHFDSDRSFKWRIHLSNVVNNWSHYADLRNMDLCEVIDESDRQEW